MSTQSSCWRPSTPARPGAIWSACVFCTQAAAPVQMAEPSSPVPRGMRMQLPCTALPCPPSSSLCHWAGAELREDGCRASRMKVLSQQSVRGAGIPCAC